ncbi:M23 family peptidase [Xylanibacillus composti]|uniref:Stage II sporulation protein Q n=1 Tax=Xylanibacillus composti TaxID=1572762 RepID=A0A8J4H4U9_9BACL|nr:M23 family metallopeptidase [Xylanibacillus composti]MDT9725972.1 M23 family peptidase [Xylanibacillus composti]GIQ70874.1 stage II sporulation protein Q [Xylanibacillus composti]
MSQENKNQQKPDSGSQQEKPAIKHETAAGTTSSWKKLLRKKWVFPAAYMAAAAIILSLMWAYQGSERDALTDTDLTGGGLIAESEDPTVTESVLGEEDALPVTVPAESMQWPFVEQEAMDVIMPFYEETADAATKQAATIQYNNTFMFSTGLALAHQNDEAFEVLAAMSGTVTRAEQLPLVGNVVEITHEDGLKTVYQSLGEIRVKMNDRVSQGMVIGTAGRNELQKDLGVHLQFEIQENDRPVNPQAYLPALHGMEMDEAEAADAEVDEG